MRFVVFVINASETLEALGPDPFLQIGPWEAKVEAECRAAGCTRPRRPTASIWAPLRRRWRPGHRVLWREPVGGMQREESSRNWSERCSRGMVGHHSVSQVKWDFLTADGSWLQNSRGEFLKPFSEKYEVSISKFDDTGPWQ